MLVGNVANLQNIIQAFLSILSILSIIGYSKHKFRSLKKKMSFHKITPLPPHNITANSPKGPLSSIPQGDRSGEVQQPPYREMIYCTDLNLPIKLKTV